MDFKALSNPIVMAGDGNNSKPSFFQKIRSPFSKFSPKMQKAVAGGLVVLLVFALVLGVYITRNPTQLAPQASLNAVDISIKPQTISTTLNQEFQTDVFVDTGQTNFKLSAVQAKVNYDPAKLELKTVALKDFLPVPLMAPANTAGNTKFIVGSNPTTPPGGSGTIATITFKALVNSGSTQITFDNTETQIAAIGQTGNKVGDENAATVNFGTTSSPSPSNNPNNPNPETSFTLSAPASVTPNQQFEVKVYSRSDIDSANLWNAKISFPKDLLQVVSFNKTGSFITNWAEEFFDNSTGEISLTGGVTNPGLKTNLSNQLMTTIVFKAKTGTGTANINLVDPSTIYRNSDSTKILQTKRNITVAIANASPSPSPSPSSAPCASPPICPNGQILVHGDTQNGSCQVYECVNNRPSPSPSPTCRPRPACLDATPRCLIPETSDMCPKPSSSPQAKGDGNNDGKIDLQDLSIMFSKWSPAINIISHFQLDFNDDLKINSFDYSAMRDLLKTLGVIRG